MEKEKIITGIIISVQSPACLIIMAMPPQERLQLFIIPDITGFISAGFLVYSIPSLL
jgi:hypothetical protein